MEQTAEELREQVLASRRNASGRLTPQQQRLIALGGVGVLAVALVILLINAVAYTHRYEGRIYRGVRVAGVYVGGLERDEAIARVDEQAADWAKTPLAAGTADGQHGWQVFPYDLGVSFDSAAAVDEALDYGRNGWALSNFGHWFGAFASRGGANLHIPATLDDGQLELVLRSWAPGATYYPTDAVFTVADGSKLTIVADKNGVGFDLDGSRAAFLAQAARLGGGPATMAQVSIPAPITANMLHGVEGQAAALADKPLTVRSGDKSWTLPQETIASAIGYKLDNSDLVVALSAARLAPFFAEMHAAIDQPGVSAKLVEGAQGRYSITPSKDGVGLDEQATLAAINAALQADAGEAQAVVNPKSPPIVTADLEPVKAKLDKITSLVITATFEEYKRQLYPADIWPLIHLVEQPDKPEKVAIQVDEQGARALVQVLANDLNQDVRNAQFAFSNGAVRDVVSSLDGRVVQVAPSAQALRTAILGASATMTPVVTVTKPKIPSAKKEEMQTPDRLAVGRTDFSFSIPSRWHNVELAAERLNGALIPPGEEFSFNEQVGEQTVANGYEEAYGIAVVTGAGGVSETKTVSSVAGGICQVSTTLFHAVFRSGLPVLERNHHLFWVAYAASNSGMMGLDATVDDQSGLDFKFENTTGGWLGIEAVTTEDGILQISLYGKDPGWNVVIDDPIITNIRVPDPKPAYDKTHDLVPGAKLLIEHAAEGFDASIRRRVYDKNGAPVLYDGAPMDLTLRSSYLASRDRYQIGVPENEPLDTPYVPPGEGGNSQP
ncbi:MAG: VanW family protein [Thermomicrobiales bacterium]